MGEGVGLDRAGRAGEGEGRMKAHCCICHETFDEADVIRIGTSDVCPKCRAVNFTIVLDGDAECECGEKGEGEEASE